MIKFKKAIAIALIVVSVLSIVAGIIFIAGCDGNHTGLRGGVSRANTDIEFGGDFYTTSARYTALAANAATDIYTIASLGFGTLFVLGGLFALCFSLQNFFALKETKRETCTEEVSA